MRAWRYVEESLLKLVPLGGSTAAAYAGDVDLAAACLDFIRSSFAADPREIATVFQALARNLGPFEGDRTVEILLVSSTEAGSTTLVHWSTKHGLATPADFYEMGSFEGPHARGTRDGILKMLRNGAFSPEQTLAAVRAAVQSHGLNTNVIERHVGGAIFGLQTSRGLVSWHPDTNVVFYDRNRVGEAQLITMGARHDTLIVDSGITRILHIFGHSTSAPDEAAWLEKLPPEGTRDFFHRSEVSLWCFLDFTGTIATLVFRPPDTPLPTRYFESLSNTPEGNLEFRPTQRLRELLYRANRPGESNGINMEFVVG